MYFSLIIPIYNRPDEIDELLQSLTLQSYSGKYEVVIIEDGSTIDCKNVVDKYSDKLQINYFFKPNSGPGDSRNFGMKNASGDYYIILDSDCILPVNYLKSISDYLGSNYVDFFGGPDAALDSFSDIQKAINFSMTSFLTTGGIRGGSERLDKFQPRSFNMGISKNAFEQSLGFGKIHPGEDPDLTIRLWKLGFKSTLIKDAYVYHKRRIDWNKFFIQVNKFGLTRPILNLWHPEYAKITYWFPTVFIVGLLFSLIILLVYSPILVYIYLIYFILIFVFSLNKNRKLKIALYSLLATFIQFYGYGIGFLRSYIKIFVLKQNPNKVFPKLFFK